MQRSESKQGINWQTTMLIYSKQTMAENPDTKKEIIYPIIFDGDKTQSWGMAAIIIGARGAEDKDVLLAHSGVDQGWAGFRATSNLVHLFDFQNDEEPKASEIQDKRGIFYDKGRSIDIIFQCIRNF